MDDPVVSIIPADFEATGLARTSGRAAEASLRRTVAIAPCCIWLTGLSGSGKSTLSALLIERLRAQAIPATLLDGDLLRQGLNRDLGFSEADRRENVRRVGEVARLMVDAGLVAVVSLISPLKSAREDARRCVGGSRFVEVFVDAPLSVCERRDPKGLYRRARRGEIPDFTGIDSPFEAPIAPDVHLRTHLGSPQQSIETLLAHLCSRR